MPNKKPSRSYRMGYRLGSAGTKSGKRPGATGRKQSISPRVWIGLAAVVGLLIIIGLVNGGGSSNHSPGTTVVADSPSDDVTVDSCLQNPVSLDMVALGRIMNGTTAAQDYQLFISYFDGNGQLISSSRIDSFSDVPVGQTEEFNLTKGASGTVDGLTCKPEVTRSPTSGG